MPSTYVEVQLHNGIVQHWLAAGPQAIFVDRSRFPGEDFRSQVFQHHYMAQSGISATPVERGPLDAGRFTLGKYTGAWSFYPAPEDHSVDHSGYYPACHYLRSWAYIEAVSTHAQTVLAALTTYGRADVWAGGKHLFRAEPDTVGAATLHFPLQLDQGVTPLLVRFENVGIGHITHAIALRLCRAQKDAGEKATPAAGVHLRFRTLMPNLGRRNAFAQLSAAAYMDRDVYEGEAPIQLRWPASRRASCFAHVRLLDDANRIYLVGDSTGAPGDTLQMGHAIQLPAGPLQTTLTPSPDEVYLQHMRYAQTLPFWSMGRQRYHTTPWGDMAARRNEALLAAAYVQDSVFAQIARMAWGAWADVDRAAILAALARVQRHEHGSNLLLLALLGMVYRWGDDASFPDEVRQPLEACSLGYRYQPDDPGSDLMDFTSKSNPILFHVCEVLAGQFYPDRTFADGQTGEWHRARGERLAQAWLAAFGAYGAAAWNSPDSMDHEVAALVHLCDFAEAEPVYALAAVALDKLLFALALHSLGGVLGVVGRYGCASFVKSGLLQPTAPICNLMWGMGIYNQHVAGVLSLACSTHYQMPTLIETIAHDIPAEVWSLEQHAPPDAYPAHLVTYKTPDYILSSVQAHRPGQPGDQEMAWRATLGAEAIVFTTHPGSSSESDSRAPGYWSGNARLPRVAQWKDALISIHRLAPEGETEGLLNFTHAYFPTTTFDDYVLHNGWAFAQRGDGYLAITHAQGFTLSEEGRYAQRELRAEAGAQIWLVQMGRAAQDDDFAGFQVKVLALPIHYAGDTVRFTTLRGDTLEFGWEGLLRVNGEEQLLDHFNHYANLYTTTALASPQMEIQWAEAGLRLDFTNT